MPTCRDMGQMLLARQGDVSSAIRRDAQQRHARTSNSCPEEFFCTDNGRSSSPPRLAGALHVERLEDLRSAQVRAYDDRAVFI